MDCVAPESAFPKDDKNAVSEKLTKALERLDPASEPFF